MKLALLLIILSISLPAFSMTREEAFLKLGLASSATQDDIKQAYRKLTAQFHPDRMHKSPDEAKFKNIKEAYELLYSDSSQNEENRYNTEEESEFLKRYGLGLDAIFDRSIMQIYMELEQTLLKTPFEFSKMMEVLEHFKKERGIDGNPLFNHFVKEKALAGNQKAADEIFAQWLKREDVNIGDFEYRILSPYPKSYKELPKTVAAFLKRHHEDKKSLESFLNRVVTLKNIREDSALLQSLLGHLPPFQYRVDFVLSENIKYLKEREITNLYRRLKNSRHSTRDTIFINAFAGKIETLTERPDFVDLLLVPDNLERAAQQDEFIHFFLLTGPLSDLKKKENMDLLNLYLEMLLIRNPRALAKQIYDQGYFNYKDLLMSFRDKALQVQDLTPAERIEYLSAHHIVSERALKIVAQASPCTSGLVRLLEYRPGI